MYTYSSTNTETFTSTFTRMDALMSHFELFLTCSGMKESMVEKLLHSVSSQELIAVGIYLEKDGYRICEVEFRVDWEKHGRIVAVSGELFDPDIGGWKNNVSPEAYLPVQRLVKFAKDHNLQVASWIKVSPRIQSDDHAHKALCDKLGYSYKGHPAPWKGDVSENLRNISGLEEADTIVRNIPLQGYWP